MLNKISPLKLSLITAFTCFGLSGTASALPFDQISQVYFLGDSLTDGGFNDLWAYPTPLPAGKAPTFTTYGGFTWAQYVAHDIKGFELPTPGSNQTDRITNNAITPTPGFVSAGLKGVNFAAGGSTTDSVGFQETWAPSLHQQVDFYLSTVAQKADPKAVYFIWSGANDILTVLLNGDVLPTPEQLLLAVQTATSNIAHEAAILSEKGATRIVVMGMPNIGKSPLITEIATKSGLSALPDSIQALSVAFNTLLDQELKKVITGHGTHVLFVSTSELLDDIITATEAGKPYVIGNESFQFANYTDPACATVSSSLYCPSTAPKDYIFADALHPTDRVHRIMSLKVESLIRDWE